MRRSCYYHAGCPDGFGAAWSVWRAWGEGARYLPRGHSDPFEASDHVGEQVVFADISLANELLRALGDVAEQVIVLDHHITAQEDFRSDLSLDNALTRSGHVVSFDLSHSGSVLAWHYFHPDEAVPELLRYVEDQDLWSWKLPLSAEVNAAIGSYPRRFDIWTDLAERPWQELAAEGAPILRAQRIEVERALHAAHPVSLGTRRVEAVNAMHYRSVLGHELAKRATFGLPIGLVYRLTGTHVDVSIYSIGDENVAAIACTYGGGGHHNAAGFSIPLSQWLEEFA